MKTAYILHGVADEEEYYRMDLPSPSNAHWLPWLQQKFLRAGYLCQCLEMPTPPSAKYSEWADTFGQVRLDEDSIIVGHSAGCGFILKWLSENESVKVSKLVLVAPWLDPFQELPDFLQGELDKDLADRVNEIKVLYSEDEPVKGVRETKDKILSLFPKTKLHLFEDKGHFCLDNVGHEFKELWDIVGI